MFLTNWLRHRTKKQYYRPAPKPRTQLGVQQLESREVPAANFASALGTGSAGADAAFDVATDAAGNAVMVGYFKGTVDFDPVAAHAGDSDIRTAGGDGDAFVAKYAPDGSFLWVRQMVGAADSRTGVARCVTTDAGGNVYVSGDFRGSVGFGPYTLTSAGDKDAFAAKLAADGTVLWATRWGGADLEYSEGIAVDGAGNVLTAGYTVRLNANGSQQYVKLQVRKFDAAGSTVWEKQIGNSIGGHESAFGIGADAAGNVYVCGAFAGTVDFDPAARTKGDTVTGTAGDNGYVLKLTAAGAFGWVSPFVGQTSSATSQCYDLAVDGGGNVVVGGAYRGSVDFKPGAGVYALPTAGGGGGFVAKLNSTGALVWAQPVGTGAAAVHGVTLDSAGGIYVVGQFQGQADFNPGTGTTLLTSNGGTDMFVAKFSSAGTFAWAVSFGGSGSDRSEGIAVDAAGNVYLAGYYSDTVDFDPDPLASHRLTSAGANDIFLVKLKQS